MSLGSASREVECPVCNGRGNLGDGVPDDCTQCYGMGAVPRCTACGYGITGCVWNGGKCLDCHERSLLPETALDRWEGHYA